jgi:hypothetical protein
MTLRALLEDLQAKDICLKVVDGKLWVDAPKGKLTPDLRDVLRRHKADLVAYLRGIPIAIREVALAEMESQQLLAWASQLAEQELVLPEPVTYIEAPLRTIITPRVSCYAALYLREISYARLQQRTGGWGCFTSEWFKEQERGAIEALAALREAIQTQVEPEADS